MPQAKAGQASFPSAMPTDTKSFEEKCLAQAARLAKSKPWACVVAKDETEAEIICLSRFYGDCEPAIRKRAETLMKRGFFQVSGGTKKMGDQLMLVMHFQKK